MLLLIAILIVTAVVFNRELCKFSVDFVEGFKKSFADSFAESYNEAQRRRKK